MKPRQRVMFLLAILAHRRKFIQEGFAKAMHEYQQVCADLQDTEDGIKLQILKSARVVGFTVTGGAMYARLISALKPSVVIIEEAGTLFYMREEEFKDIFF